MHRTFPVLFNFYLLIHLPFALFGQDPYFINYDTKDGLPSSEVYDVEVDSNGMVWFATDRGICSYNGYEFKTYTTEDGLANNTLLAIWKDRKGNFWFPGIDGSLSIYDHEKFYPYRWNDGLKESFKGRWIQQIAWDQNNKLYFWISGIGALKKYVISNQDGEISEINFNTLKDKYPFISHEKIDFIDLGGYYIPDDTRVALKVIKKDSSYIYIDIHKDRNVIKEFDQISMISAYNNSSKELMVKYILNIITDSSGNIWLCTKSGVYKFTYDQFPQNPIHYFKNVAVSDIHEDSQGNYWLTTLENGILLIPSFNFHALSEQTNLFDQRKMMVVLPLKNHLIFGNSKGEIIALDQNKYLKNIEIPNANNQYFFGQSKNNKVILRNTIIEEVNNQLVFKKHLDHIDTYYAFELNNGQYVITTTVGFKIQNPITKEIIKNYYTRFLEKIVSIFESHNTLWLGTINGLFSMDNSRMDVVTEEHNRFPLLKSRINDIKPDLHNNLWLATVGNGLLYKTKDTVLQITTLDGLNSNFINRIFPENDSTIWVATNIGLDRLIYYFKNKSFSISGIETYNTSDGLLTNYINDITKWNGKIWLATNKGINYFDPEAIDMTFPPPKIILEEIAVNDSTYNAGDILNLKHFQNDLYFKFTGISYRKQNDKPFYRYRLKSENTDSTWYFTNNRDVRFNDLLPGEYTFEVAAQNKHGQWSEKPVVHNFTIQPHFTQTNWFRMIGLVTIVGIIAFAFQTRSKRIKREEEQKRKVQEAELQALRNQMNPHFVFNALNSIQNFVFKNDAVKANYYLSRFSRLMRDGLQFARLKYISLEEEIIFLNTYLELEKMRFPDKFQYVIKVDEHIPASQYSIPPLLFQPILENAVKHAFKNIDYEGYLEICFEELKPGELLKVTITDNGEGIIPESVNKHTKSKDKSLGIEIINNQIALLNQEAKDNKASFRIFNRNTIDPQLKGTQAEFIISIKFSENDKSSHH